MTFTILGSGFVLLVQRVVNARADAPAGHAEEETRGRAGAGEPRGERAGQSAVGGIAVHSVLIFGKKTFMLKFCFILSTAYRVILLLVASDLNLIHTVQCMSITGSCGFCDVCSASDFGLVGLKSSVTKPTERVINIQSMT